MILVCLEGGLGNQLFQYAAGRSLALRHGVDLVLDTSLLTRIVRQATPRQFELKNFRYVARIATSKELRFMPLLRRAPLFSHCVSMWRVYTEQGLEYNEMFDHLTDQTCLKGYWQSPRYFDSVANVIVDELQAVEQLSDASGKVAHHIGNCNSVAIHVRRGDYVTLQSAASYHGIISLNYYTSAIEQLRINVDQPHFFVFSDDIPWCCANLPLRNEDVTYVSHNYGSMAWQDLVLMSRCRHHVIANSSFSWWGAWLADQQWLGQQRQVFAPANWLAIQRHDIVDRFPPHWKMLKL